MSNQRARKTKEQAPTAQTGDARTRDTDPHDTQSHDTHPYNTRAKPTGDTTWALFRAEFPPTLRLAGPVVAAQLGQMSMGFIDTVMVGRLGKEALAGVALGNTLFFFLLILCTGMVQAVGPMVSQAVGAGKPDTIERSVRQGLWLGVILSIPVMILLWNIEPILHLLGQSEVAVDGASSYIRAILWAFLPACWFTALRSFVEGLARPLPVTLITIFAACLNAGANYVLMFGAWKIPALGLVGTGLASTLVFWTMFAMLGSLVVLRKPFREYTVFGKLRTPDTETLRTLVDIGWPMGVSRGIEAGLFMITALMVGTIGATSLAAHQVAIQCAAFMFMVPMGVGIAGQVRVGHAAGRGDRAGTRRAGYASISLATIFMTGSMFVFLLVPEWIVSLYLDVTDPDNAEVVALAVQLVGIAAVFQVVDGLQIAAAEALRGLKDTRGPLVIGFFSYWGIGLTLGYLIGVHLGYGAPGLWWGLVAGLAAASVWLTIRFHRQTAPGGVALGEDHETSGG
jgi:multidrug resistance protein, MATE family